jgi:CRISPR/Cas system-associated endonuclease Cas1
MNKQDLKKHILDKIEKETEENTKLKKELERLQEQDRVNSIKRMEDEARKSYMNCLSEQSSYEKIVSKQLATRTILESLPANKGDLILVDIERWKKCS